MIGEPPVVRGSFHVKEISVLELITMLVARPTGGSGTVYKIAPFPSVEAADSPYILEALTVAIMGSPSVSRKGVACMVKRGMVHLVNVTRAELLLLQFFSSSE
jgi:hypothetical protein